ncbi:ABC transporter substrate-binding protein [Fodinibius salinus]|nr:NrtA/SsuA/CpmA family ABC transporter substrate-binding protein [Fodinibius salinus]
MKLTSILALVLLVGCNSNDDDSSDLTTVRVGVTTFWGEAAYYIAQSEGFFEEEGLEIIDHPHSAGRESLKELYQGKLDIAHVAEIPVVRALSGALPYSKYDEFNLKIFTGMIYTSNSQKVIARRDHGIENPQDLRNKKVGLYYETTSEYFFDTFLLEHGIPEKQVEKVNIDISEHYKALKNGQVDAVVSWEPHASQILKKLKNNTFKLNSVLGHSTLWLGVSSETYIQQHPETIVKYLRALKKAQDYIKHHPEETKTLVSQKTKTSLETIENLWPSIEYELSIGQRMLSLLNEQQRWFMQEQRVADTTKQSNVHNAIYFDALQKAHPEGITVIQ